MMKQPKISLEAYKLWEIIAKRLSKELTTTITVSKAIEIIGGREAREKK